MDAIEVKFEIPADVSDEEAIRCICEFAVLLDELHRAYGGSGLKVVENAQTTPNP